jgi:imidazolonepropionase-like amidohydrolase
MKKILRCGTLYDGIRSEPSQDVAIVLKDSLIEAVIPWKDVVFSGTESVEDYSNYIVAPGFIDAHVHLLFTCLEDHDETRERLEKSSHEELTAVALRNCADSLLGGITTVRDLGDIDFVTVTVRNLVKSGIMPGPSIFAAGPPVTTTAGHLHWCGNTADTIEEIRKAVRRSCAKEVDVIKVMASGGNMTRGSNPMMPQYEVDELKALVTEAHRLKRRVAAHSLEAQSIRRSIAAGIDTLEHCTWRGLTPEDNDPQQLVDLLKGSETMVTMTLAGIHRALLGVHENLSDLVISSSCSASVSGNLSQDFNWARALIKNGIDVALASDAGVRFTSFRDFNETIEAGMMALDIDLGFAISMATGTAAKALGISETVGTIKQGMQADISVMTLPKPGRGMGEILDVYKSGKKVVEDSKLRFPANESFGTLNSVPKSDSP